MKIKNEYTPFSVVNPGILFLTFAFKSVLIRVHPWFQKRFSQKRMIEGLGEQS